MDNKEKQVFFMTFPNDDSKLIKFSIFGQLTQVKEVNRLIAAIIHREPNHIFKILTQTTSDNQKVECRIDKALLQYLDNPVELAKKLYSPNNATTTSNTLEVFGELQKHVDLLKQYCEKNGLIFTPPSEEDLIEKKEYKVASP